METYLNGWKEIATYLGRGLRTVQRWEALYGLPVTRPAGKGRSAVVAATADLDAWLRTTPKDTLDETELPNIGDVTVLSVDDNAAFQYAISRALSKFGHHVERARSGEEALEVARKEQLHVVLMDVQMPGVDGFEVCRRFKEDAVTRSISVLFLTAAERNARAIQRGIEVGAEAVLFAPIDPVQLSAVIVGEVLKARRQRDGDEQNVNEQSKDGSGSKDRSPGVGATT